MIRDDVIRGLSPDAPCEFFEETLHLWIEGEADPLAARELQSHLGSCAACERRLRDLEQERIAILETALTSPPLSLRFPRRVTEEILRHQGTERIHRRLKALRKALVGLAAAAAVALSAFALERLAHPPAMPGGAPAMGASLLATTSVVRRQAPGVIIHIIPEALPARLDASERCIDPRPALASDTGSGRPVATDQRINLANWIEFSAEFFHFERHLPCHRDVNQDGLTDISDAAHLFMLAVGPVNSGSAVGTEDGVDLGECLSQCQI